jgi:hypothetical protein
MSEALLAGRDTCYLIVASLPALPRFDRARRLPISRRQLDARLSLLEPGEARLVDALERFLEWQHHPVGEESSAILAAYERLLREVEHPILREMMIYRMNLRTIMAALRRRHHGHGPPRTGEVWGVGRWVRHVEANWSDPHLGLSAAQPWVARAHALLESGDSLELERLLMGLVWDHLLQLTEDRPFSLEYLLGYTFRWDILHRWLSADPDGARARLDDLVSDALDGCTPVLG